MIQVAGNLVVQGGPHMSANPSFVLTVWFDKGPAMPDWPPIVEDTHFLHLPLWKHKGQAVYSWAVDYVSCSDVRMVVLGPFETIEDGKAAYLSLRPILTLGYRLEPEHCFVAAKNFPHCVYTDG